MSTYLSSSCWGLLYSPMWSLATPAVPKFSPRTSYGFPNSLDPISSSTYQNHQSFPWLIPIECVVFTWKKQILFTVSTNALATNLTYIFVDCCQLQIMFSPKYELFLYNLYANRCTNTACTQILWIYIEINGWWWINLGKILEKFMFGWDVSVV